jgi:hypothetical protein
MACAPVSSGNTQALALAAREHGTPRRSSCRATRQRRSGAATGGYGAEVPGSSLRQDRDALRELAASAG